MHRGLLIVFITYLTVIFLAACTPEARRQPAGDVLGPPRTARPVAAPLPPSAPPPMPFASAAPAEAPASVRTVKVGFLVPLSGSSAALGTSMLDAASLALFDKYDSLAPRELTAKVVLVPKDSGDTPESAAKAAKEAIDEGAELLLGPLFSASVNSVAAVARAKGVNLITFSNNRAVLGRGVYLFGFMPEEQARRVANFAAARGITRMGVLAPGNPYGQAVVKELTGVSRSQGTTLAPVQYYPNTEAGMQNAVSAVLQQADAINALFIAEGGAGLNTIVTQLQQQRFAFDKIRLIGTGLWDDAGLLQMPGVTGGWFASSPADRTAAFEQRFNAKYHYQPARLASLAYDAVALATTLALDGKGGDFSAAAITNPAGFSGPANGIFRFTKDGVCERGLAVMEITPGGFRVIDAAPTSFAN